MNDKPYYTLEEVVDELVGPKGTPQRDAHDAAVQDYIIGESRP